MFLVVLGLPSAVRAATTLYVDKGNANCSNTGSGTATQPFCTISAAASRVTAGATVLVSSGTYNEQVSVSSSGTASAPISFLTASGATVTVTGGSMGFSIVGRSYITVQGFNVTNTTGDGIYVKNSSHITIRGNRSSFSGQPVNGKTAKGLRLENSTDSTVEGNTIDHNSSYGIYVPYGSTRNLIQGNVVFNNAFQFMRAASGIRVYSSPGNTVASNVSHDNEDSGIEFDSSSNGLAYDNVIYNNGDHGIDVTASSTGVRVIANTVYKSVTAGIDVEGSSTGTTIANNVAVDNGINSPRAHSNIRVDSSSVSGTTMDYDLVFLSTPDTMFIWNNQSYSSLSALTLATGKETHGIQADPRFTSAATGNFHLSSGSQAIDSANSGASGQPSTDADGNDRFDDPATPNTGAGPRLYDDRGAYEFRTAGVLDHIVVSPASATISAGGSQTYSAEGFDAGNSSLGDVTASTTFSISPNGSCTGNVCTATVAGTHTVTGNDGGKTATASLTVTAGALDHLVLSPASATISSGGSQAYTAEGRDQYDNSLGDVTSTTTFSISPDGSCTGATCTASAAGTHTVTGTKAGKTGTASLNVTASTLDHIVIRPASATISAGGSQTYSAEGFDAGNNSLGDVTAFTTFTVAPDGSCTGNVCTATVAGAHTVTGNDGGKTATASLTVTAGALDHLALSPASASIAAGGSQTYTADGRDQYDNSLGDVTSTTTFSISPDGSCTGATCTASVAGTHTVTGTKTGKRGTATLTVTAGTQLDHIVISPASATTSAGGSQTYSAEGFDAGNNSLGDVTASTAFSISPNGSCTGNACTATVAGAHTVTGNDGGKTATASLTVTAGALDHLALSPASASIASGGSQTYSADGRDQYDNSLGDVTSTTTFSIAPDGSCTGATCTASVGGTHTVTGTNGGKTGTATLTVTAGNQLDHIVITPATANIGSGGSQAYTAEGFDAANNSLGDVTAATTFAIAPDGSCTGSTCTATTGGRHTVTGNDGGKTATASLSVSFVKNPGFETDTSGWSTSGSGTGITLTRVAGGHSGNWSAQLTNTGTTTTTFATLEDSPNWVKTTIAGTYTAAAWVRADTAGAILKIKFQEYSGTTLVSSVSSQITLSTSWQQVSVPYTIKSPGSTLDLRLYVSNPAPGTVFYADDISLFVS